MAIRQQKAGDVRYAHIKFPPYNPNKLYPKWVTLSDGKERLVKSKEEEIEVTETPEEKIARLEKEQVEHADRMKNLATQIDLSKNLLAQSKPAEVAKK